MAELDHAIAVCDSMLELDEDNAAAYLYRGWAYMNKAQTHLIARRMRATAGDCRRGKRDLDKFYEYQPEGEPDASTVLGAYLFYADTLPGFFKFIRWLIRVPGGDRERGLELLRQGAAGDGYTSPDAELVLAVTYYLFDGNLEDAVTMLGSAIQRYPHHPWVVEYTCSMSYLYPEKTKASIAAESVVLDGWDDTTRGWEDAVKYRLRWTRARLNRQLGRYDMALVQMAEIIDESPQWPHWMVPRTHMEAIELAVSAGRADEAMRLCQEVPDDERYAPYRQSMGLACADVDELAAKARVRDFATVRTTLYAGRVEEAAELLEKATSSKGNRVERRFLEGEIARYQGRVADAIDAYEDVENRAQESGADALYVHALQRMGEIYLQFGYYQFAEQCYNRARDTESPDTMLSNLIRGRLRYIERQ
jgi:tetratricopeptide (TPR) repeat protein